MLNIFPADEYALFDAPVVTYVNGDLNLTKQLVGIDPTRAVLIISAPPSSTVYVFPGAGNTGPSNTEGILANGQNLVLNWQQHGPLVCSDWYIQHGPSGIPVTAVTLSLRRNPKTYGYQDVLAKQEAQDTHASYHLPTRSRSAVKIPSNRAILRFLHERRPDLFGER